MRRTVLAKLGKSDTATLKREIQRLVREVVMKRDGTCILRGIRHCNDPVLQADHLITRSNSATYADTRLIVCLCRTCHGWKHFHEREYNELVKSILSKERVELWDRCEKDSWRPKRTTAYDWRLEIVVLEKELASYPPV